MRATPGGCVECLMCGSEFIAEVPADMLSGGVPHPAASKAKETDSQEEDVPGTIKGLKRAKIVPCRMSSTEKIPEFHPDVARGTVDDVSLIERMHWSKNAFGIMAKKYEGMEKEAVRDWKMHIKRFITMRLGLL